MAEISAAAVRALRDRTDLPMMDCKRALTEANGDQEKAIDILRREGKKAGDKRKDNATSEGRFRVALAPDGSAAAMVEVLCESAPVAKSDDFLKLGDQCAQRVLAGGAPSSVDELLAQAAPDVPGKTLRDLHEDTINKIREKIVIGRFTKVVGPVGSYVHHDGKIGVLFQAEGQNSTAEVLKDVAMHIAAFRSTVTFPEQLNPADVAAERARLSEEAKATGKPAGVIEKMVDGRIKTFYQEKGVLVEQLFAKDQTKTVGKALQEAGLKAKGFIRWVLGQSA